MTARSEKVAGLRWVEAVLAAAAAMIALIASIWAWQVASAQQPIWPLPALYLIEIPAVSAAAALAVMGDRARRGEITWAAAGVLLGFAWLGALSVGFLYLPSAGLLLILGELLDRSEWRRLPLHLGLFALGAVAQIGVMLALIPLLSPGGQF